MAKVSSCPNDYGPSAFECIATAEAVADEGGCLHDDGREASTDPKTLANRRRKEKKRTRKESALSQGSTVAPQLEEQLSPLSSPDTAPTTSPSLGPSAAPLGSPRKFQPTARKGGRESKENAAVRLARERLEQQRRLEEERAAAEEERRLQVEEEKRLRQEAEAQAEAELQRRREARQAKVEKAKSEGTYMTKAQKQRAAKAAHAREQLSMSPGFGPHSPPTGPRSPPSVPMSPPSGPKSPPSLMARQSSGDSDEIPDRQSANRRSDKRSADDLAFDPSVSAERRSLIVCILGHVDAGKTKLLDRLRRTNVQEREAGGITQQIGATFFPKATLREQLKTVDASFECSSQGLLIIDTPGHESFSNLRTRGSSLCDIAVVVVDITHGLEAQAIESLKLLQKGEIPFLIALNKVDNLYNWVSGQGEPIREAIQRQEACVRDQFQRRFDSVKLELNERGFNAGLYWESEPCDSWISIVPTSAKTGEGIADLLYALLGASEAPGPLRDSLNWKEELRCTVMEVKHVDGHGTTVDVMLQSGTLREGERIALGGMNGPIVTTIRALLTPQPLREMRVKGDYTHHASISTAMGVKISAAGLEKAVCGSEVIIAAEDCCTDELRQRFQSNLQTILMSFEKEAAGVYVKASTIGSLEALLSFLKSMKIPVAELGIGEVHKKDVKQAAIMREKKQPEYALILAFDVKINPEAKKEARHAGVQIFSADIMYHLLEQFTLHMEKMGASKKPAHEPVFPVLLEVYKPCKINAGTDNLIWCEVVGGQARVGTALLSVSHEKVEVGRIVEILKDRKAEEIAYTGDRVCLKLSQQPSLGADLEFAVPDKVCSALSRESNEALKEYAHGEMRNADWALLEHLKKVLSID